MNENQTKLLQELANKIGTTMDKLWQVLLHQAFISAITDIAYILLISIFWRILYVVHKKLSKPIHQGEYRSTTSLYEESDLYPIIMVIFLILISIISLFEFCGGIPNIINGLFNPEYWALDKILSSVK